MASTKAIELQQLEFSYRRKDPPVLQIPSLTIDVGERVFLRGESGSGKTTLLGLIAGLQTPQKGSVRVLGTDLFELTAMGRDRFRGRNIGYIFQMLNLVPYLNVFENVLISVGLTGQMESGMDERALQLLSKLGLQDEAHHSVQHLSVGQQQRVACARALIGKPGLLIADEPTSALDYSRRDAFLDVLFSLCEESNTTLVFVSHDPSLQSHFDRVVEMGRINSVDGQPSPVEISG